MGTINHNAIIVTAAANEDAEKSRNYACEIFDNIPVSEIIITTNGYASFFIPPDGSKEGWPDSDTHNELRNKFIAWLNKQKFRCSIEYIEVSFGEYGAKIENTNCGDMFE